MGTAVGVRKALLNHEIKASWWSCQSSSIEGWFWSCFSVLDFSSGLLCDRVMNLWLSKLLLKQPMLYSVHINWYRIKHLANPAPIMIQPLTRLGIEGNFLNLRKSIYKKPTTDIIFNGEKLESISFKIRNKSRISTLTTYFQHSFGNPSHSNLRTRRNKRNPNWKRSKTVTVCRWHNTICRKSWKCYQKTTRAHQWIW